MPAIRLVRTVDAPGNRGPSRGMFALQAALHAAPVPWLHIGGFLRPGEIPWVWSWQDIKLACEFSRYGWPYIIGPNVLFSNSKAPGWARGEREILDSEQCVLQFTESPWYAALIAKHCNHNQAPIVLWPYPISPSPDGPMPAELDVLLYLKDLSLGREALRLQQQYPKSAVVVYGKYARDDLISLARKSRCCVYLSRDDRGPLAAAEIAIAGCPLVGIDVGCPWCLEPGFGVALREFVFSDTVAACEVAIGMDREAVRSVALAKFNPATIAQSVIAALRPFGEAP